MKAILFQNQLVVRTSPLHGYGVFAGKNIEKGELIEECLVLTSPQQRAEFDNYYFNIRKAGNMLALGFGSLYNHARDYNAWYIFDPNTRILEFRAERLIRQGEEIVIFYSDNWFGSRKITEKRLRLGTRLRRLLFPSQSPLMRATLVMAGYVLLVYGLKILNGNANHVVAMLEKAGIHQIEKMQRSKSTTTLPG